MQETFTEEQKNDILRVKTQLQEIIKTTGVFDYLRKNGGQYALSKNMQDSCVIAGGIFTSLFRKDVIKDIDVFLLKTHATFDNRYVIDLLTENKKGKWTLRYNDPDYHKNEHILMTMFNDHTKIQYILTDYVTRQELIDHFDYVHCLPSYVHGDIQTMYITPESYEAIHNKYLIVNNENNISDYRKKKYMSRGWIPCVRERPIADRLGELIRESRAFKDGE